MNVAGMEVVAFPPDVTISWPPRTLFLRMDFDLDPEQELVPELAELGLMGMTIPDEYGGAGADTLSYALAIEELARVDSSVAITVAAHHSLGTLPIWLFGSEEQKRE